MIFSNIVIQSDESMTIEDFVQKQKQEKNIFIFTTP